MVTHNARALTSLIKKTRDFKGLTRKFALGEILNILGEPTYDDAGFFDAGEFRVVVSCDGIVESLVKSDPILAGYYSVLVNVNDVVAKGARPIGFVNIISSSSSEVRRKVAQGIREGLRKYKLKLLKGHTHPDTSYDCVDAAVVGVAKNVLPSFTAEAGDSIVVAVDLDGNFSSKGWLRTFDSTTMKSSPDVMERLESMIELAERGVAHAARDISGPGIIGTIAMLCESSRIGARVNLGSIPRPMDIELEDWLVSYPGIGFIISTDKPLECLHLFRKHKLVAATIGEITANEQIWLSYNEKDALFLDLRLESVFGLISPHQLQSKNN